MAYVYRSASLTAARICGDDPVMDIAAGMLLGLAKARAVDHILTGAYISQLFTTRAPGKKGVTDRLVVAGDKAAISIEYGHSVRINKGRNAPQNSMNFRWVPGQFILTGAINEMPGTRSMSFGSIL